jgi:hypothetical protein
VESKVLFNLDMNLIHGFDTNYNNLDICCTYALEAREARPSNGMASNRDLLPASCGENPFHHIFLYADRE